MLAPVKICAECHDHRLNYQEDGIGCSFLDPSYTIHRFQLSIHLCLLNYASHEHCRQELFHYLIFSVKLLSQGFRFLAFSLNVFNLCQLLDEHSLYHVLKRLTQIVLVAFEELQAFLDCMQGTGVADDGCDRFQLFCVLKIWFNWLKYESCLFQV